MNQLNYAAKTGVVTVPIRHLNIQANYQCTVDDTSNKQPEEEMQIIRDLNLLYFKEITHTCSSTNPCQLAENSNNMDYLNIFIWMLSIPCVQSRIYMISSSQCSRRHSLYLRTSIQIQMQTQKKIYPITKIKEVLHARSTLIQQLANYQSTLRNHTQQQAI